MADDATTEKTDAAAVPPLADAVTAAGDDDARLLVILDSHGLIYRSYFALRDSFAGRTRKDDEPTWAVYGYANSLLHVLDELRPSHIIAAWDSPSKTFRHEADAQYKATRPSMPDDLRPQIARVREVLDAFRIPVVEAPGFEADDVLGTLARQAAAAGVETVLVTLDNDIVQLVEPRVRVYMYRPYQRDYVFYDEAAVQEKWGFTPQQMPDFKALVGDNSDNISGVKGIGDKGGTKLVQEWGSIEAMLEHLDDIKPPRAQKALREGRDDAVHSKHLATIVRDVPDVALDLPSARVHEYDRDRLLELFQQLEFRSLIGRLPAHHEAGTTEASPPETVQEDTTYTVVTDAAALAEVVQAVSAAPRLAVSVVSDDAHPMRASDTLVGLGISIEARQGWYIPFGHIPPEEQQSLGLPDLATPDAGAPDEAASDEADSTKAKKKKPTAKQLAEAEAAAALAALGPVVQLDRAEVFEALRPLLEAAVAPGVEGRSVVAHDGKRLLLALSEVEPRINIPAIGFDTMVAAYLVGNSNITVRGLAFDRLGLELVEPKTLLGTGKKAIPFSRVHPQALAAFACGNADLTLRLAELLAEELEQGGVATVFADLDMPHVAVLARMEHWGLHLDVPVLREMAETLATEIAAAQAEAYEAVGHEFNLGSPKELSVVLFEELGLPTTRRTKTGWTTDATALDALRTAHPVVPALLRWRELTKINSTYVETLPQQVHPRTGRVHSDFSQVTAATGRLASNDPNLQNIPVRTEIGQGVRRAFTADDCGDDPVLASFDYSQIELRVLAHVCGDTELRAAFDRGDDIHAATASNVFGVEPGDVTPEQRRRAKVFNFGVLYGLSEFGLSQREGIPREEAAEFIAAYFAAYPTVQEWRDAVVTEATERGYAETLIGRRRYIPGLNASNRNQRMAAERVAVNMPIQGTAADIIKIAMNRIDAELSERQRAGARARLVLQVHDELIFELPRAELDDVREMALRLMPSVELAVPLEIDEKVGHSWGEMG